MTKAEHSPRARLSRAILFGAIAAVVAAVLYGTLAPTGKLASSCPASSRALAAKLEPLAKGEMAALNVTADPREAIPLTFERLDGAKAKVSDFSGKAVLLNLWATWCVPCRAEMPSLDRLQAEAGGDSFEVVAVNVDTARLERRAAFLDAIGVKSLTRYADPSGDAFETLRKDGKTLGLPVTVLIDRHGCEVGVVAGAVKWDSTDALAVVQALKGG